MIILGLGSNLGDRLENLRHAINALKKSHGLTIQQISPIYTSDALLPDNAPTDWDMSYLNLALRCETTLEPLALLKELKRIEFSIGRKPEGEHWGPRVIDIDILAWDERIIQTPELTVPHISLQERPFALWPLADIHPLWKFPFTGVTHGKTAAEMVEPWGSRFSGKAPFHTHQINQRIETPKLVGILNITPDSFSDGNQFVTAESAIKQAAFLTYSGAEIIDIGAESTAPKATPIDAATEWKRLEPILLALKQTKNDFIITPKISVDTRHAEVAAKALQLGVDWINDVSGLDDPAMRELIAHSKADCVVMHHLSIPERRDNVLSRDKNPVETVYAWGEQRLTELEQQGIARERIIFDPGIGFGKMAEQSLLLLQQVDVFAKLGVRVLIGHSRKTFLSLLTGMPSTERDVETMAMSLYLAKQPVDYLRVHNVEMCARGLKVMSVL